MHTSLRSAELFPHTDKAAWKPRMPKAFRNGASKQSGQPAASHAPAATTEEASGMHHEPDLLRRTERSGPQPEMVLESRGGIDKEPPAPPSAPLFRDLCYLHELRPEDLLSTLCLEYDVPQHLLRQLNGIPFGSDLDEIRAGSVIVIPLRCGPEDIVAVADLCESEELLGTCGDKLTPGFRRGCGRSEARTAAKSPPPSYSGGGAGSPPFARPPSLAAKPGGGSAAPPPRPMADGAGKKSVSVLSRAASAARSGFGALLGQGRSLAGSNASHPPARQQSSRNKSD